MGDLEEADRPENRPLVGERDAGVEIPFLLPRDHDPNAPRAGVELGFFLPRPALVFLETRRIFARGSRGVSGGSSIVGIRGTREVLFHARSGRPSDRNLGG